MEAIRESLHLNVTPFDKIPDKAFDRTFKGNREFSIIGVPVLKLINTIVLLEKANTDPEFFGLPTGKLIPIGLSPKILATYIDTLINNDTLECFLQKDDVYELIKKLYPKNTRTIFRTLIGMLYYQLYIINSNEDSVSIIVDWYKTNWNLNEILVDINEDYVIKLPCETITKKWSS